MSFKIRRESALKDLEDAKKQAAELGSAAYKAFEDQSDKDALKTGIEKGIIDPNATGSSSSSSSDSSDSDGDSGDGDGFDDFGSDDFSEDNGSGDDNASEPSGEDEESENKDDAPSEEKEEAKADEEEKVRTESLRTLSMVKPMPASYRQEGFMSSTGSSFLGGLAGEALAFVVSSLVFIGMRLTPAIISGLYKVVLYTFAQCFSILGNMFESIETRIERFVNRTSKQKEQLEILKKEVAEKIAEGFTSDPERDLDVDVTYLRGGSDDFKINIDKHVSVLSNEVTKFQKSLLAEFTSLRFIAKSRYLQRDFDALSYMGISPQKMGVTLVEEKDGEGVFVDQYALDTYIGNVSLVLDLPKQGLDTWENIEKAYKQARVALVAVESDTNVDKPKVMTPQELQGFINSLESLIGASFHHQKLYETILEQRSGVFNDIKAVFVKLANETFKSSFRNSTALPLQLKSSFVTKVYVVGAMDLHDHTARVIANGLSFASSTLKTYKKEA